mmetsp:Transcript_108861/g.307922  ORF Transcript_108861/g.307922 Transcript_108861/m.307922 type:complete len:401 (-) Transcript_108861:3-1205(-)
MLDTASGCSLSRASHAAPNNSASAASASSGGPSADVALSRGVSAMMRSSCSHGICAAHSERVRRAVAPHEPVRPEADHRAEKLVSSTTALLANKSRCSPLPSCNFSSSANACGGSRAPAIHPSDSRAHAASGVEPWKSTCSRTCSGLSCTTLLRERSISTVTAPRGPAHTARRSPAWSSWRYSCSVRNRLVTVPHSPAKVTTVAAQADSLWASRPEGWHCRTHLEGSGCRRAASIARTPSVASPSTAPRATSSTTHARRETRPRQSEALRVSQCHAAPGSSWRPPASPRKSEHAAEASAAMQPLGAGPRTCCQSRSSRSRNASATCATYGVDCVLRPSTHARHNGEDGVPRPPAAATPVGLHTAVRAHSSSCDVCQWNNRHSALQYHASRHRLHTTNWPE